MNEDEGWMPPEAYANIAAGIIDVVRQVSDSDFQQRVWIRNSEPGVVSSYEEGVLGVLFDYDADRAARSAEKYGFDPDQAAKLRLFVKLLNQFSDQHPHAVSRDVVGTQDWAIVQRAAADFIHALNARDAPT